MAVPSAGADISIALPALMMAAVGLRAEMQISAQEREYLVVRAAGCASKELDARVAQGRCV